MNNQPRIRVRTRPAPKGRAPEPDPMSNETAARTPQWLDDEPASTGASDPSASAPRGKRVGKTGGDYEVGYGKPPVATRFKPNNTANPRGRPRGAKNFSTLVREKLGARIDVRENGRTRRASKAEIGVTKLVNRFTEHGGLKEFTALLKLLENTGEMPSHLPVPVVDELTEETNRNIIAHWTELLQGGSTSDDDKP